MPLTKENLRYVFCGFAGLDAFSDRTICQNCAHEYKAFNGTKFLGSFSRSAQWFGGNSTCLPFSDGTFDISVANAALHHMNDVTAAISEMIRVTKPGGQILLVSDPFMKSVRNPDERVKAELAIFDRHPMVLNRGIAFGI